MNTLYLDQQSTSLQRDGKSLAIYIEGKRHSSVPITQLQRIVTFGKVVLDTALLGYLQDAGVEMVMFSGRQHKLHAHLHRNCHNEAQRRIAQYQCYYSESFRNALAQEWVAAKIRQQQKTVQRISQQRPDLHRVLLQCDQQLQQSVERLQQTLLPRQQLLGVEGAAARSYFQAYGYAFPPALGFSGRARRPPPDPINSLLSLGYSMLHTRAVTACYICGLDPAIGFYHELSYGRESLASDLIEPLRPRYDRWVWRLIAERELRDHHFSVTPQGCLLAKEGREKFFPAFEKWTKPIDRYLRQQGYRLVRRILQEQDA